MNSAKANIPNRPHGRPIKGIVFQSELPITLAQSHTAPAEQNEPPPISCALLCIHNVCADTVNPLNMIKNKPANVLPNNVSSDFHFERRAGRASASPRGVIIAIPRSKMPK